MKILILTGYYLPGFKAGGPIRSLSNLVEHLGESTDFHMITRDRDLGATQPYPGIQRNVCQQVGNVRVKYVSDAPLKFWQIFKALREVKPDILYVNSYFDPILGILPLLLSRLGILKLGSVIIASRGIFSPQALVLKSWKKRPFLFAAKALGLTKHAHWHATCEKEKQDIQRVLGKNTPVSVISDLVSPVVDSSQSWSVKEPGNLNLVFLARIARIKNLCFAIEALRSLKCQVSLDIYGLNEDAVYWQECQQAIKTLPSNVSVNYRGVVAAENADATLARYDALFLPSQSENFGYSIIESLTAGSPVIIGDATPWRDLQDKNVGWDLSLQKPQDFIAALTKLAAMNQEQHLAMRIAARKMGLKFANQEAEVQKYSVLFESLAGSSKANEVSRVNRAA